MVKSLKEESKLPFLTSLLCQAFHTTTEGKHQTEVRESLQDGNSEPMNSAEKRLNRTCNKNKGTKTGPKEVKRLSSMH